MSDTDDLEAIRERKLRELRERVEAGETDADHEDPDERSDGSATSATPDEPIAFGGGSLADYVGQYDVALVDFHADWCGPCRMMETTIDRIAAKTDAAVVKVDADRHQGVCREYGVQGLPTLLVFKRGEVAERFVGAQTEGALRKAIRNA